jgi:hypothetical protein
MRRIVQFVALSWKRSVHKKRVGCIEGAVPSMGVPKNMEHRLYTAHRFKELAASSVILGARSPVEDAKRWTMGHENIYVFRNLRIDTRAIAL